jgi:pimeloyl-ACP methyl ester carboxylesterase
VSVISSSSAAPDRSVTADGVTYAYRSFGAVSKPPLLLLQRFRGTMDHWDPKLLDSLAAQRQVILFDNEGIGLTPGTAPNTIAAMAKSAAAFIEALRLPQVDLLGWSMGGTVAQQLTLERPDLVRRLALVATGPGGVPDAPRPSERVIQIMMAADNSDEDFLYLFFDDSTSSKAAGAASLRRLDPRLNASRSAVKPESFRAQAQAIGAWGMGKDSAFARLAEIKQPVLVANGVRDVMIHAVNSYAMVQRLPRGKLVLYPDSGHGFLFQHVDSFSGEVLDFLQQA